MIIAYSAVDPHHQREVLATNGDTHLGGEDFDHRVVEHLMKLFEKKHKIKKGKLIKDKRALQKLRREAERAKRALSSMMETRVEIEAFDHADCLIVFRS